MNEDSVYIRAIRLMYDNLQNDIAQGKNLEKRLKTIDSCMNEIAQAIPVLKNVGEPVEVMKQVYDELALMRKQISKALS